MSTTILTKEVHEVLMEMRNLQERQLIFEIIALVATMTAVVLSLYDIINTNRIDKKREKFLINQKQKKDAQ